MTWPLESGVPEPIPVSVALTQWPPSAGLHSEEFEQTLPSGGAPTPVQYSMTAWYADAADFVFLLGHRSDGHWCARRPSGASIRSRCLCDCSRHIHRGSSADRI